MSADPRSFSTMFSIDVTADARTQQAVNKIDANELICVLLRQLVEGQQKEIKLLEEIAHHVSMHHKQRQNEIGNWKETNPDLARSCRIAAEALAKAQNQFIHNLTEEVADSEESLTDSDYMLSEFIDRFGPRLAHLNGLLQVLSQLSTVPNAPAAAENS
jgi:phage shock protein A